MLFRFIKISFSFFILLGIYSCGSENKLAGHSNISFELSSELSNDSSSYHEYDEFSNFLTISDHGNNVSYLDYNDQIQNNYTNNLQYSAGAFALPLPFLAAGSMAIAANANVLGKSLSVLAITSLISVLMIISSSTDEQSNLFKQNKILHKSEPPLNQNNDPNKNMPVIYQGDNESKKTINSEIAIDNSLIPQDLQKLWQEYPIYKKLNLYDRIENEFISEAKKLLKSALDIKNKIKTLSDSITHYQSKQIILQSQHNALKKIIAELNELFNQKILMDLIEIRNSVYNNLLIMTDKCNDDNLRWEKSVCDVSGKTINKATFKKLEGKAAIIHALHLDYLRIKYNTKNLSYINPQITKELETANAIYYSNLEGIDMMKKNNNNT